MKQVAWMVPIYLKSCPLTENSKKREIRQRKMINPKYFSSHDAPTDITMADHTKHLEYFCTEVTCLHVALVSSINFLIRPPPIKLNSSLPGLM